MNYAKGARYLLVGLVAFFTLLAVCILIRPIGLVVNSGISYYGNYNETLLPFTLAFLTNSFLLWRASLFVGTTTKMDLYFKFVLKITSVLMIGILLTPYDVFNLSGLNLAHRTMGTAMFSIQMIMAVAIVISNYRDKINILLISISLIGGYAAFVYLLQPNGYMIEAQIVFQISVWLIFIRYLSKRKHKKVIVHR